MIENIATVIATVLGIRTTSSDFGQRPSALTQTHAPRTTVSDEKYLISTCKKVEIGCDRNVVNAHRSVKPARR